MSQRRYHFKGAAYESTKMSLRPLFLKILGVVSSTARSLRVVRAYRIPAVMKKGGL